MDFVHLHNHTEYSLLDGANRIPDLVQRVKELGMSSVAITDHGVMFGVAEFYWECLKQGVKPIIGVEAYIAPNGLNRRDGDFYHLLLLAQNNEGYRNLCRLMSIAALEGFYSKPRIDFDLLAQYSDGVIATSTCLGSEVNQALLQHGYERAQYLAGKYKDLFGPERYFIELQDHGLPEDRQVREPLIRIARELGLKTIATNDSHYLCQHDAAPHDVLLCIQTNKSSEDKDRMRLDPSGAYYVKSPEEMLALFPDAPDAIENTAMVADMCHVELKQSDASMPTPDLPEGETPRSYLRKLATERLHQVRPSDADTALQRLHYELDVIEKMGFESYFLLVKQFTDYARDQGIYYGLRGSAAGSLVSYTLGISSIDPLEYDLTFERFLNPERISMPDIDLDFEDARRQEIIDWVSAKYGSDHVAQIITFGTLGAKAAIKDCGRVLGYTPRETDEICKTIPNTPKITIENALRDSPEFRKVVDSDPRIRELIETAKGVEGIARNCSVHAAGVVISSKPLREYIPLYRTNNGDPVTAFEGSALEKLGLLKMDFLGLANLTIISRTLEYIHRIQGIQLHVQDIPLDDDATFQLLSSGETTGVFQLESSGMRRYIKELRPQNVRELAAMIALYRPGPMDHIHAFIEQKFGRAPIKYLDERMRPILEETYGIIVYQDQVLKLVQALAGFSLGKADILRRAMGKKDEKAMASMKVEFVEGCAANGITAKSAEEIWVLLEPFAGYAFNKAHAVCYAMVAYQTAYLKAHYPVEYLAACLSAFREKEDKVTACINECRRSGISINPPDVNRSGLDFSIEGQNIRFGLAAIKGVGNTIAKAIIAYREKGGPYTHLYEFAERLRPANLNRSTLEALIRAGALDSIDPNRAKLLDYVEAAQVYASKAQADRQSGQMSMLGEEDVSSSKQYPVLPAVEAASRAHVLAWEKELLGVYVSDHPLRGYELALADFRTHTCAGLSELGDGTRVTITGILSSVTLRATKRGDRMALATLEDFEGQVSLLIYPKTYEQVQQVLVQESIVKVDGVVTIRERGGSGDTQLEVRVHNLLALPEPTTEDLNHSDEITCVIHIPSATLPELQALREVLTGHPGAHRVVIACPGASRRIRTCHYVAYDARFAQRVRSISRNFVCEVSGGK